LARLDAPAARAAAPESGDEFLPAALRSYLPGGVAGVKWRMLARGIGRYMIPCRDTRGFRLSLMRIAPGRTIPRHTHRGDELVLVLDGGYHDEFGHYGRGDVEAADASVEHHPVADPGRDCIGLVVDQGPARLTGRLGRLINPFMTLPARRVAHDAPACA
jgi:putative transcriptional regulator